MYQLTNYGGTGLQVVTPDPPDAGGAAINDNFKAVSDAFDGELPIDGLTVEGTIAASAGTGIGTPLVLSRLPENAVAVKFKSMSTTTGATLTTATPHGFVVGETVIVSISDDRFDGTWVIGAVGGLTSFSYGLGFEESIPVTPATGTATAVQTGDLASFRNSSNAVLAKVDVSGNVATPQLLVEADSSFTTQSYHLSTAMVTTSSTDATVLFSLATGTTGAGNGLVGWINVRCLGTTLNVTETAYFERRYLIQSGGGADGETITPAGTDVTTPGTGGFGGSVSAAFDDEGNFAFLVTASSADAANWRCTYEWQFITGLPT